MREIKFRFWDKFEKKMVYRYLLDEWQLGLSSQGSVIGFESNFVDIEDCEILEYPDRFVPLQFTGILDERGEEIYEGDIVTWEYSAEPQEVFWDNSIGGFSTKHYHLWRAIKKVKIIGNIYQTLEEN